MAYRKVPLVKTGVYHIFTRSIANFRIFNSPKDYERMQQAMVFYSAEKTPCKFSLFDSSSGKDLGKLNLETKLVRILAYCFMPTHVHFILEQMADNGISRYINLILKSYSAYFNIKHKRRGPLWEGRFKSVLVETDEQLLHLTRYIHLNPASSSLVDMPHEWRFSSYKEYLDDDSVEKERICDFSKCFTMEPMAYKKFVEDRIDYQRDLENIKHLLIE